MPDLYVRIKGRVQGPFGLDKLQAMVRRGQLSRIHQVSEDQEVWKKATEYPALFQASETPANTRRERVRSQDETADVKSEPANTNAGSVADWYVEHDGQPQGPLTFTDLRDLFRSGKYSSTHLVWREGMDEWVTADSVDGLISVAAMLGKMVRQNEQEHGPTESLNEQTINILSEGRGWIVLSAVILTIWGILSAIGAFIGFVQGVKMDSEMDVLVSMVAFGFALVLGVLATMQFRYANSLLRIRIDRDIASLNFSLQRLNRYWVSVGSILLLGVLLFVIGFILELTGSSNVSTYW